MPSGFIPLPVRFLTRNASYWLIHYTFDRISSPRRAQVEGMHTSERPVIKGPAGIHCDGDWDGSPFMLFRGSDLIGRLLVWLAALSRGMTIVSGEEVEAAQVGERPYNRPYFQGPKTVAQLREDVASTDAHTLYFDLKFNRARELLIFMEETKIWQELLQDCVDRAGVNAGKACSRLTDLVAERIVYHNSNFNAALRPSLSPGIPVSFEKTGKKEGQEPGAT